MPSRPKLSMPLKAMQRAIGAVLPATERLTTVPALAHVRVSASRGAVEFAATGRDLTIRCCTQVPDAFPVEAFTMPGRRTADFARLLEGDTVDLAPGTRNVSLRCGGSDARVATLQAGTYPQLPPVPSNFDYTMPAGLMDRMMAHVLFAVSTEKDKSALRGALLEIADGNVHLVTTDGHRLARYSAPCKAAPRSWLLPAALLKAASARASQSDDICSVAASEESTFLRLAGSQVMTDFAHAAEKGRFPHYRGILPKSVLSTVTLPAPVLQNAVRRCLSLADSSAKIVRVSMAMDSLKLHSADAAMGETDESLPATSRMTFQPLSQQFRGEYLLDILSRLSGDVELSFAKIGSNPGLWVTCKLENDETFECALMGIKDAA